MRSRKLIRFIIVWFFIIAIVITARISTEILSAESDFSDAYSAYGITTLLEDDGAFQVLDLMNNNELMTSIKSWSINRNITIEDVCMDENLYMYVLVSYTDEETNQTGYDILKYDESVKITCESGWFVLNWKGQITDMDIYEGIIYLAQLGSDNLVYEYDQKVEELVESNGYKKIPSFEEPSIFYADKTYKAADNKTVRDAYIYQDMVKILTTDTEEINPKLILLENSRDLRETIVFTPSYLIRKFIYEYYAGLFAFVIGTFLFILIPKLLEERNRIIIMLIIWETILLFLLIGTWYGYRTLFNNVSLVVLFLTGSLIGFLLLRWESYDLRQLTKAVVELTEREVVPEKPDVFGKDVRYIWNGLIELGNKVDKLSRAKQIIYDTLNRYVPMGVTYMAETGAITDLNSGDIKEGYLPIALVGGKFLRENKIDGSLMAADNSMATYFMKFISKYQSFKKSILLGMSSDMSVSEFLFTGDHKTLHTFGLDFHSMVGKYIPKGDNFKSIIVIHYCDIKYGVVGTTSVMHQFVYSKEISEIEDNFDFLKSVNVDFVLTKEAIDQEKDKPCTRYIGALDIPSRLTPLELYQVLDNMSQSEKHMYLDNLEAFNKGMTFLKEKNFYLARNTFAEVLHNVPSDGIAKYYLYLCEKNLELSAEDVTILLNK